jgi:hypothetical protein
MSNKQSLISRILVDALVKFDSFSDLFSTPLDRTSTMAARWFSLAISIVGGQKRLRSLPSIFRCFSAALGGLAVHEDRVDDQLDATKDEAYPIWDLQRSHRRKTSSVRKVCK